MIELQQFNPAKMRKDSTALFIGKRGAGKTHCLKYILSCHKSSFQHGLVICPPATTDNIYQSWVSHLDTRMLDNYTEDEIFAHVKTQSTNIREIKRDYRSFVVLDNCTHQIDWKSCSGLKYLLMNGRQLNTLIFITMQYLHEIPSRLIPCIDYVFLFKDDNINDKRRVYQNLAGMFPSFDQFLQVMDKFTDDFECIVIDNTVISNKLEDCVFRFRADCA